MSKVKGLLFDFNGTLFFDSDYHIEAIKQSAEIFGVDTLTREFIVSHIFGRPNEEIVKNFVKPDASTHDIEKFEQIKEDTYRALCKKTPDKFHLCNGVPQMLDYLKSRDIPFCIATGSPYSNVEFYFEHLGLARWFTLDNLVYSTGDFNGKPAPDIYLRAAERIGLDASECAVFEDATSGILAARAASAAKVICVWEEGIPSPVTDTAIPDAVYHDFSNWKAILADLGLA